MIVAAGCGGGGVVTDVDVDEALEIGGALFVSEGCVNCHGEKGEGIIGPSLANGNVVVTFPSCVDQIRWVELGSARWKRDIGPSYGAQAKPVKGGMPAFGERLSGIQIRSLATFTRVEFGQLTAERVFEQCFQ
jgi:mono/diheme cytochrome c family protein